MVIELNMFILSCTARCPCRPSVQSAASLAEEVGVGLVTVEDAVVVTVAEVVIAVFAWVGDVSVVVVVVDDDALSLSGAVDASHALTREATPQRTCISFHVPDDASADRDKVVWTGVYIWG